MTCPVCGTYAPDDPETGYAGPDICPSCQAEGFTVTAQGEIVNEQDGPCELRDGNELCVGCGFDRASCRCQSKADHEDEDFAVNGQDVRR